jgi:UDP-N-acetylmuramate--alanine ligase
MGPLAEIAQDAGYHVTGSDLNESLATRELESRGIDIVFEQTAETIASAHLVKPIDWLVYTSALADDHPELVFARENGIRVSKRDEFLSDFIDRHNLELIAVAGTHGKTTTTGMLIWTAKQLGLPISYSIGSTIDFGPSGQFDPVAKYFIYEADEYDRNFLQFHPTIAVLPAVDYDHADIYATVEDYKTAFRTFVSQSDQAVMFERTRHYLEPLGEANIEAFDHQPTIAEINLPGQHIRDNAYLAAKTLQLIDDYADTKLYKVLAQFPGTNRRFEKLADGIYSDYAHHPQEIAAAIQLAREVNPNVVVIYQPHQNERQHTIADQYKTAFAGAKHVYWLPTYSPGSAREKNQKLLSPDDLITQLDNPQIAEPAELDDQLWENILVHRVAGDLILLMSAGTADAWLRDQVNQ